MVEPTKLNPDEPPDVGVETPELLPDGQEGPGVPDGGIDLEPVADDAGVGEELIHLPPAVPGDGRNVETVEGRAVVFALFQDGVPAQPGLGAFEDEKFELHRFLSCRNTGIKG